MKKGSRGDGVFPRVENHFGGENATDGHMDVDMLLKTLVAKINVGR